MRSMGEACEVYLLATAWYNLQFLLPEAAVRAACGSSYQGFASWPAHLYSWHTASEAALAGMSLLLDLSAEEEDALQGEARRLADEDFALMKEIG